MSNGSWIKLSVGWDEDERIATLPKMAQLTYIKVLTRAKRQRPQGQFGSLAHLRALMPKEYHKHIQVLLKSGLLLEDSESLLVQNWSKHQVDPTRGERVSRFRTNQRNANETQKKHPEREKEKEREKERDTLSNKPMSIGEIIRRGGAR
ncbi:hypothetical protein UFOVP1184_39 [uncultured Caudovirales phage]|uniref:Uncharacterized protein n=1 Tax=uncultured Caudovirales phage TaxID=2100421 RepID=A0A6J5QZZ9_9CAUD|nr:hypothetical protein UFOVP1184_39 [uncultured Caudovirales phage]